MPSRALRHWQTRSRKVLDEFEAAHALVGGTPSARRFARQQIAQAYVVLLCSQFQRFCRELHTEAADGLTSGVRAPLDEIFFKALTVGRKLDVGNPGPGNLGSDFSRFGIPFWDEVRLHNLRNEERQRTLEQLNRWRNAIAHQDFTHPALAGDEEVDVRQVRKWRRTCETLAVEFDTVIRLYLRSVLGRAPW